MNHTCKQDFSNLEHLSSFHNHILIVMFLRYLFFDVNPTTIFKGDVIMTLYVNQIKPFDVSFINRLDR